MTAILAIENLGGDAVVTVGEDCVGIEGSSAYLRAGESYSLRELLYAALLVSGNDAAMALALGVSESREDFAALMNEKAAQLGMTGSSFKNPHGLDEDGHHSTARDLAVLAAYCMENELFRSVVSSKSAAVDGQTYLNHNKLLWNCEGVIGVKTGYTKAAGRSLISCCERNGTRLICVTLGAPDDWADHAALYDWAYSMWKYALLCTPEQGCELPVVSGKTGSVAVSPEKELRRLMSYADEAPELYIELPRLVFAPVEKGERLGRAVFKIDGEELGSVDLVASESVELDDSQRLGAARRLIRLLKGAANAGPYYYGDGI